MQFIQRKDINGTETVDEFYTYKEARLMLAEYQLSDQYALYYISERACREWYRADIQSRIEQAGSMIAVYSQL